MKANEFLEYAGTNYESLKKKWSTRLKKEGLSFSEDTSQNTILKICDYLDKHEDNKLDKNSIEGFWYKAFLTNTKRDGQYHYHKRDDSIDVIEYLSEVPADEPLILLEDIEEGINSLTEVEKYLFLIYYLTDVSYPQLEELTGIKDIRYQLKKIIKKIRKQCLNY